MNFFNRMKDSISSAGTGVSQKVSYTTDTVKLNNQIRGNEKEIEKLVYQIGQKCVHLHLNDTDSEYEELFKQIRQYQEANSAHRAEIQRLGEELKIQEQMRQQELKEKQERREQEQQADMQKQLDETTKLCKSCNQRSDLDAKFCVFCGEPFGTNSTE